MKKTNMFILLVFLLIVLCSCNSKKNSEVSDTVPTQGSTQPTQAPTDVPSQEPANDSEQDKKDQQEEDQGDLIEEIVPEGADVIMQGVYYYELAEFSGDYGDGLSPREGAELANELLTDMELYSNNGGISALQCVYISLDELVFMESTERECYVYSIGLGTPEGGLMGNDYQVIYRIAVDYSGDKTASVYENFSGESDQNDGNTTNQQQNDMWLDVGLEGLVWDNVGEYTLDDEIKIYANILGGGNDIQVQIENYLYTQELEVSEWLSLELDEQLSETVGYPVWIAEYYVGYEEDTNLCVDAVVSAGEFNNSIYTLILHTIRDADLDMNSDINYDVRIKELFATITVMTM